MLLNTAGDLAKGHLGHAARLVGGLEEGFTAVSCGDARSRPSTGDCGSEGCLGLVVDGPILVAFLEANHSRGKLLVQVECCAEFGVGGGVESVDVVGKEADISRGNVGEWEGGVSVVVVVVGWGEGGGGVRVGE
jgi:hypothetical protein